MIQIEGEVGGWISFDSKTTWVRFPLEGSIEMKVSPEEFRRAVESGEAYEFEGGFVLFPGIESVKLVHGESSLVIRKNIILNVL